MDQPAPAIRRTAAALERSAVDCLPEQGLAQRLALAEREGRPLRVKLGIDPTAPDIHLGHTVVLGKLREFQDAGHTVVLIIGDYTGRVGDPSGRSVTRPVLSGEQIDHNARTFQEQALKVLDRERLEVRRNGEWLDMPMEDLFRLARRASVAQILDREDFARRHAARDSITILELLYPLLQAYDSVAVHADVEIGGTDQLFNLLLGREIQRAYGQPEQVVLTMPILVGTDGRQRMSKSLGNYVAITDPPDEIYGKTLSIPDDAMAGWFELLLGEPAPTDLAARDAKRLLARRLVARYYDDEQAEQAEQRFDRIHLEHQPPEQLEEGAFEATNGAVHLPAVIAELFGGSRSEARRLLEQGGVRLDGETLGPADQDLPAERLDGAVLQVGKRRFRRLRRS